MPCTNYRPDHNGECLNCDEPASEHAPPQAGTIDIEEFANQFKQEDHDRIERVEKLIKLWDGLPVAVLLADLSFAVQYLMFRHHQECLQVGAQQRVEWPGLVPHICSLCGKNCGGCNKPAYQCAWLINHPH